MPLHPSLAVDEVVLKDADDTTAVLVINGQPRSPIFIAPRDMAGVSATELVGVFRDLFEHRRKLGEFGFGNVGPGRYDLLTDGEFADHMVKTQNVVSAAHAVADSLRDSLDSNWLLAAFHGQLLNYAIARQQLTKLFAHPADAANAFNDAVDQHGWENLPAAVIEAATTAMTDRPGPLVLPAPDMGQTWPRDRDRGEAICDALAPWWTRYAGRLQDAPDTVAMPVEKPASWRVSANDCAKFFKRLDGALRDRNPGTTLPDYIGSDQQWKWLAHVASRVFPEAFVQACANALPQAAYTVAHVAGSAVENTAPLPQPRGSDGNSKTR